MKYQRITSELPASWVTTTVGELFKIVGGGTPSTKVASFWNGSIPWITSADIGDDLRALPRKHISSEAITRSATSLVPKGTLIVATRVGLGKIGLADADMCFSQDCQGLVDFHGQIDRSYALHCLSQAIAFFKYEGRGTTISGITKDHLADTEFPLPPHPEQRRIVAKIEELFTQLDAGVEALKRVKLLLKRHRQSVLKAAFEGRLTAEWRKAHLPSAGGGAGGGESAAALLERIKAERKKALGKKHKELPPVDTTSLPELPEGWAYLGLDHLAAPNTSSIRRGPFGSAVRKEFFVPAGYRVYEQGDVIGGHFGKGRYYINEEKYRQLAGFRVEPGDVLITCAGTVGRIAVLPQTAEPGIINQALLKVSLNPRVILTEYFSTLFSFLAESIVRENTRGSAMVNLTSIEDLRAIGFPTPSLPEQAVIVEQTEQLFSITDFIEQTVDQTSAQADRLRQSILKRAFEGKLVPQDPTDEPAEKLLERIRAARATSSAKPVRLSRPKHARRPGKPKV